MIMKRLQYILNLLLASLLMTACTKELVNTTFEKDVTLKLRFASEKLQSRAGGDVTDPEYAFYTIDLFLYPNNTNQETVEPIITVPRVDYGTTNGDTDNNHEVEVSVTLSDTEMKNLFGNDYATATNNLTCYAYAIVNGPDIPSGNEKTIANLKQIAIEATFTAPQTRFVMDGGNTVTYSTTDKVVTGAIQVTRAASKISLFVTGIDKTVTDDAGNIWIPYQTTKKVTENGVETEVPYFPIEVAFNKGVKKANVNVGEGRPNNPHTYSGDKIVDAVFFNTVNRDMDNTFVEEPNKYTLTTTHDPFYTYSSDWGRDTNPDHEPSITLMVPWVKKYNKEGNEIQNASYQMCYYQVPINAIKAEGKEADCFERNTYYRINLHVGILGDFNPNNPVKLTASYYVVDWEPQPVDVNIKNYKYLVVDKNDVTVYNEDEIRVGYAASDDVTIVITEMSRPNLFGDNNGTVTTTYYRQDGTTASVDAGSYVTSNKKKLLTSCTVSKGEENGKKFITLKHELTNADENTSVDADGDEVSRNDYDYVPYTIKVKVTMTVNVEGGNKTFEEEIVYTQYPAMYIEAKPNSKPNDNGGVYVNGGSSNYGGVHGLTGNNKNPNMYVITTTALPSNSTYIIGDPRTTTRSDESNWSNNATSMYYENSRDLDYYNPTDAETNRTHRTFNMIAPKFRIASSYGVTDAISYENAYKRCASYQEDGYPAGRWRMPTYAEYSYLVMFSYLKLMPELFTTDSQYWYAHGHGQPNNGSVTENLNKNNSYWIRCVYDEWYWNDTCNKTTFTWGDKNVSSN